MGYSLDRSIAKKSEAKIAIIDAMRRAEWFGLSHEDEMETTNKAMDTAKGVPGWVKSYLQGWIDCMRSERYVNGKLVFAHVSPDGVLYTGHKDAPELFQSSRPLYDAGRGAEISTWPSAHFWAHNAKPYFSGNSMERCDTEAQKAALNIK